MNIEADRIKELKEIYDSIKPDITERLDEFVEIHKKADNNKIFEELSFCILSSGVGPRMAQKSVEAIGEEIHTGTVAELTETIKDIHKYPDKVSFLVTSREYIRTEFNYSLFQHLSSIEDRLQRREFIAENRSIKGIGFVQASHFLRNIGFKGYAILDRNILNSLFEIGVIDDSKPPSTKKKYIEKENMMIDFSDRLSISIDELDLLLWYRKNNKIPR